jgi:hypothetical protein
MTPLLCVAWCLFGQAPAEVRFAKVDGGVEVVAPLSAALQAKLPARKLTQDEGEEWLRVCLVDAKNDKSGPAMFGAYQRRGTDLVFRPRVALEPGQLYRAHFGADKDSITTADYRAPSQTAGRPPSIVKVLPSGDVLPANHLKFYIYFSQPMRGGQAIFQQLAIVDDDGKEVYDPWLPDEFWDEKSCCLILYIHPGRIKWGVALRELLGPVLLPNRRYRLVVRGKMMDAEGTPLGKDFVKSFRTTPERRARVELAEWKIAAPAAGSTEPVRIEMATSVNHRSLERLISVSDAAGRRIEGSAEMGKHEMAWSFRPAQPWMDQDYRISIDPELEDVAGNTPTRPFDMDLKAAPLPAPRLSRTFRPTARANR